MSLGRRIKETREAKGLSQADLAERAGVSQQMISKLERGKAARSGDLVSIAAALDVSAEFLFSGTGPRTAPEPTPPQQVACEPGPYHVAPQMTPQEQVLVEYFRALTERQRADVIRDLQATKQGNEEILNELPRRRA